jgi:serine/threonine protein kinase
MIYLDAVEKLIGEGSFGSVYEVVERSSNKKYAAKYFNRNLEKIISEEKIQSFLPIKCAYIIRFYETFNHESTGIKVIMMELCSKGSLKDKINLCKENGYFISEEVFLFFILFFILKYSKLKK